MLGCGHKNIDIENHFNIRYGHKNNLPDHEAKGKHDNQIQIKWKKDR